MISLSQNQIIKQFIIYMQKSKKKPKSQKHPRDLSFLIRLIRDVYETGALQKITIQQGYGEYLKDNIHNWHARLSWNVYDFQGFLIQPSQYNVLAKKVSYETNNSIPLGIKIILGEMKQNQRCWLKCKDYKYHQTKNLIENGCYYELTIDSVEFSAGNTFSDKEKAIQNKRLRAKQCFKEQKYEDAMRMYIYIANVTQSIPKNYSEQQGNNLKKSNSDSKRNYCRCALKIQSLQDKQIQTVNTFFAKLLEIQDNSLNNYLKGCFLFKLRYLSDAQFHLQKAKNLSTDTQEQKTIDKKLVEVKNEISKKKKIKKSLKQILN